MSSQTSPPVIVVGIDGSEASRAALRWAARQAALTGARLRPVQAWRLGVAADDDERERDGAAAEAAAVGVVELGDRGRRRLDAGGQGRGDREGERYGQYGGVDVAAWQLVCGVVKPGISAATEITTKGDGHDGEQQSPTARVLGMHHDSCPTGGREGPSLPPSFA